MENKEFWDAKVKWRENGDTNGFGGVCARIDGNHYVIGKEDNKAGFRGFAGHKFVIEFISGPHQGKIIETTNLWHQGKIPEEYRELLPDNARWHDKQRHWQNFGEVVSMVEKYQ